MSFRTYRDLPDSPRLTGVGAPARDARKTGDEEKARLLRYMQSQGHELNLADRQFLKEYDAKRCGYVYPIAGPV